MVRVCLILMMVLLVGCGKDGGGSVPSIHDDACWCGSTKVACNSTCN